MREIPPRPASSAPPWPGAWRRTTSCSPSASPAATATGTTLPRRSKAGIVHDYVLHARIPELPVSDELREHVDKTLIWSLSSAADPIVGIESVRMTGGCHAAVASIRWTAQNRGSPQAASIG